MTIHTYEEIDCPSCGAKDEVLVCSTINAQISPEAQDGSAERRINMLTCRRHNKSFLTDTPLLFHDMEIGYMARYFPFPFPFPLVQDGKIFDAINPNGQIKKRLRLGYMMDTLPERLTLARKDQPDYAAFLQILESLRRPPYVHGIFPSCTNHRIPLKMLLLEKKQVTIDIGASCAKLASNSMRQHEGGANEEADTI